MGQNCGFNLGAQTAETTPSYGVGELWRRKNASRTRGQSSRGAAGAETPLPSRGKGCSRSQLVKDSSARRLTLQRAALQLPCSGAPRQPKLSQPVPDSGCLTIIVATFGTDWLVFKIKRRCEPQLASGLASLLKERGSGGEMGVIGKSSCSPSIS